MSKVSLPWQIFLVVLGLIIPFVALYPFYKIKKLGRIIGIHFLIIGVTLIPLFIGMGLEYEGEYDYLLMMPFLVVYLGRTLIDLPFIIKWSRKWNKKIDEAVTNE